MVAIIVPGRFGPIIVGGTSAGASTTTWNPSDKNAGITLSNGDLTATATSASSKVVRSVASHSSGKYFCSFHLDGPDSAAFRVAVGVADSTQSLSGDLGLSGVHSAGVYDVDGVLYQSGGNSAVFTSTNPIIGDIVDMALDIDNLKIWFRRNGGNWNNNGSADPATNVGGATIFAISTPMFVAGELLNTSTTTALTANFGGSAYTYAAPSGFSNW